MCTVWVKRGICGADSLINLALCCLGYFPGLLHAWYIIYAYPDPYDLVAEDAESQPHGATVTYYYVQQERRPSRSQQYSSPRPAGYGTVGPAPASQFPGQESGTVNSFPPRQQQQYGGSAGQDEVPPSYQDAIRGDHKIQTRD